MVQAVCVKEREDVEDDLKLKRPSSSKTDANITRVPELIYTNNRLTISIMADELGMDKESVRSTLVKNFEHAKSVYQNRSKALDSRAESSLTE